VIGAIAGVIVVFSVIGLDNMKIDDPVGAPLKPNQPIHKINIPKVASGILQPGMG
jgi:ammonia channel protein AmtB